MKKETSYSKAQQDKNELQSEFINLFTEKKITLTDAYYLEHKLSRMAETLSDDDMRFIIHRVKKLTATQTA